MPFLFLAIVAFVFVLFLFRIQRRFLNRDIKDVASPDLKKFLNIKVDKSEFDDELEKTKDNSKKSVKILDSINKD